METINLDDGSLIVVTLESNGDSIKGGGAYHLITKTFSKRR